MKEEEGINNEDSYERKVERRKKEENRLGERRRQNDEKNKAT